MLRRQFSHSYIDLVTFWSSLCQKYQTILELESSSCITRASIRLEYLKPLKAKDYKWAFQASLAWPNLPLTGSCRLFRERYMNDRSHGKQLCLSSAKLRAVGSKPTLFIASLAWPNLPLTGSCRLFRERYMNDRSHGKQLCLSSAKLRAVGSKPTLFIANFRWTFVSKRKFDEIALFVRRKIRTKSLELSFELSHEISKFARTKNEIRAFRLRYFWTIP